MKLFQIAGARNFAAGYDAIRNAIIDAKKTRRLIQSGTFYEMKTDFLINAIQGSMFWTNDVNTIESQYHLALVRDFFTNSEDIFITPSNLGDLLKGTTPRTRLMYPLYEEQGYDFAESLLKQYNQFSLQSDAKKTPPNILLFDKLMPRAEHSREYLQGIQWKWEESGQNAPALYVYFGER